MRNILVPLKWVFSAVAAGAHLSGPGVAIVVALAVIGLLFVVITLRERRSLLREAYDKAPGGTIVEQKRGIGSPELKLTIGDGPRPAPPPPEVVIMIVEPPPDRPPLGREQ